MTELNFNIATTHEILTATDDNLDGATINQILDGLIASGQLPRLTGSEEYRVCGVNNEMLTGNETVGELGLKDGATLTLLKKGIAAGK